MNSPLKTVMPIDKWCSLSYALPAMGVHFLMGPTIVVLPGIYAKYFGLPLASLAFVVLISRLFDTVTDPLIGYCADRYFIRKKSRKPFVIAGGILLLVSGWFLFVPGGWEEREIVVSVEYLLFWWLIFYMAFTLFEVPHVAWGGEISQGSKEKTQLYSSRVGAMFIGGAAFTAIPLLSFAESQEFTPFTLKWTVVAASLVMIPALWFCIKKVPDPVSLVVVVKRESLRLTAATIFLNRPLLLCVIAAGLHFIGIGMWTALLFSYSDSYLGLGNPFAVIYMIGLIISIVTLPYWRSLSMYLQKIRALIVAVVIGAVGVVITGFLVPGESAIVLLVFCNAAVGIALVGINIIGPSLISDIVDYGAWKFSCEKGATYFSTYFFILKAGYAVGGGAAFMLAENFEFDVNAVEHTAETVFGMRLSIAWLPALIMLSSVPFLGMVSIDSRRHAIIRRRLSQLKLLS